MKRLAALAVAAAAAAQAPGRVPDAVATITPAAVRHHIAVLADDSMLGRATPSPQLEAVARYVAWEFRKAGLRPGGPGGAYLQRYSFTVPGGGPNAPPRTGSAPNVIGVLEGSDSVLKHEYVFFTAHMDHIGTPGAGEGCVAVGADSICNGADDDASGTTGVILLAHAFATLAPHPKRTLVFMTVSGEERGLWGSTYYVEHPTLPLAQTVADLNTDMIGRNWKDTIAVIGKEQSELGRTLDRVAAAHPELHMTPIGDIWPQERFYFRSDHYNFARKGVPILFFFNGTHPDYHMPGDEVAKIDAEKEARVVKLDFYLGLDVANAAARPKWDPASYRRIVLGAK